jgi:hypothetical protein
MDTQKQITAADVVAFMQCAAARVARETRDPYAYVYAEAGNPDYPNGGLEFQWKVYSAATGHHLPARTLEEAIAKTLALAKPEALAAAKREAAAKLLAEANALAPEKSEPARDEPDYDAPKLLTPTENYFQNDEHHVR